ncbi:MAG: hypothetical protein IPO98_21980 [Saprospiraceae bacterium]|nr:hypothetical protein [Saprospiraceae bacterium]
MDQLFQLHQWFSYFDTNSLNNEDHSRSEKSKGTLELLFTKPISASDIILGKYFNQCQFSSFSLGAYFDMYYSIFQLGSPQGNLVQIKY